MTEGTKGDYSNKVSPGKVILNCQGKEPDVKRKKTQRARLHLHGKRGQSNPRNDMGRDIFRKRGEECWVSHRLTHLKEKQKKEEKACMMKKSIIWKAVKRKRGPPLSEAQNQSWQLIDVFYYCTRRRGASQ